MTEEQRIPSVTVPIDRAELDRALAQMRAECPEPSADEVCPHCEAERQDPPCAYCGGSGLVTRDRARAHHVLDPENCTCGGRRVPRCPVCTPGGTT